MRVWWGVQQPGVECPAEERPRASHRLGVGPKLHPTGSAPAMPQKPVQLRT